MTTDYDESNVDISGEVKSSVLPVNIPSFSEFAIQNKINTDGIDETKLGLFQNFANPWDGTIKAAIGETTTHSKINIDGIHIYGKDILRKQILPKTFTQVGRIAMTKLDGYLTEIVTSSKTRKLSTVIFQPSSRGDQELYEKLVEWLSASERGVVFEFAHSSLREGYCISFQPNSEKQPKWLTELQNKESSRTEKLGEVWRRLPRHVQDQSCLLAVFVLVAEKDKSVKRKSNHKGFSSSSSLSAISTASTILGPASSNLGTPSSILSTPLGFSLAASLLPTPLSSPSPLLTSLLPLPSMSPMMHNNNNSNTTTSAINHNPLANFSLLPTPALVPTSTPPNPLIATPSPNLLLQQLQQLTQVFQTSKK